MDHRSEKQEKFLEKILNRMSRRALQKIASLNCETPSERYAKQLGNLETELHNIKVDAVERELEARIILEEQEVQRHKALNLLLTEEVNRMEAMTNVIGSPKSKRLQAEKTLKGYHQRMDTTIRNTETIDIVGMVDMHYKNEEKLEKISELRKNAEKFAGLPPNLLEAREAVRKLNDEVKQLKLRDERKLEEEIASYVAKTSGFSFRAE